MKDEVRILFLGVILGYSILRNFVIFRRSLSAFEVIRQQMYELQGYVPEARNSRFARARGAPEGAQTTAGVAAESPTRRRLESRGSIRVIFFQQIHVLYSYQLCTHHITPRLSHLTRARPGV